MIKFKIWDKEHKIFRKIGTQVGEVTLKYYNSLYCTLNGFLDESGDDYELDCKILQYIGLKDKNDKEIYQGDIVKTDIIRDIIVEKFIGEVKLINGGWCVSNGIETHPILSEDEEYNEIEIIGNKYTNLGILEEINC